MTLSHSGLRPAALDVQRCHSPRLAQKLPNRSRRTCTRRWRSIQPGVSSARHGRMPSGNAWRTNSLLGVMAPNCHGDELAMPDSHPGLRRTAHLRPPSGGLSLWEWCCRTFSVGACQPTVRLHFVNQGGGHFYVAQGGHSNRAHKC